MERAIQNILVNAIRYSPSGELIRISLSETHGTICGEIENTGVRVPDDASPHLFEAFYRADTSRNRNTGGTGLGAFILFASNGIRSRRQSTAFQIQTMVYCFGLNCLAGNR